jgi:hypothetical protein
MLLWEGVDINKMNSLEWIAIEVAHSNSQEEIKKILEVRGAVLSRDVQCVFQLEISLTT